MSEQQTQVGQPQYGELLDCVCELIGTVEGSTRRTLGIATGLANALPEGTPERTQANEVIGSCLVLLDWMELLIQASETYTMKQAHSLATQANAGTFH